jgi:hypothetical protein
VHFRVHPPEDGQPRPELRIHQDDRAGARRGRCRAVAAAVTANTAAADAVVVIAAAAAAAAAAVAVAAAAVVVAGAAVDVVEPETEVVEDVVDGDSFVDDDLRHALTVQERTFCGRRRQPE